MHIRYKTAALCVNTSQKSGVFAVTAVNADVTELNAALLCHFKHRQCQLRFTAKLTLSLRYRGFPATGIIAAPRFGQIQPGIDQRGHVAATQGCEDADLTVVHLA